MQLALRRSPGAAILSGTRRGWTDGSHRIKVNQTNLVAFSFMQTWIGRRLWEGIARFSQRMAGEARERSRLATKVLIW